MAVSPNMIFHCSRAAARESTLLKVNLTFPIETVTQNQEKVNYSTSVLLFPKSPSIVLSSARNFSTAHFSEQNLSAISKSVQN